LHEGSSSQIFRGDLRKRRRGAVLERRGKILPLLHRGKEKEKEGTDPNADVHSGGKKGK